MRSVVVHLKNTTHQAVGAVLSAFAHTTDEKNWVYPTSGTPSLWISFYDDYSAEFEPAELNPLIEAMGQMPDVIVIAQISGKIDGKQEVRSFAESLLNVFSGVACDEHYWSLTEIKAEAKLGGRRFFEPGR